MGLFSPFMPKTPNGSTFPGSFEDSSAPPPPRADGKPKTRYVKRHDKYYMIGGDLFVLIGDVIFKIHSFFFQRDSRNFFDDGPADHSTQAQEDPKGEHRDYGKSEDKAIRILDVSVQEFELFLWVFYNPRYDIYDAPIESWFSILKLAHRWDFPGVKEFALRELKRRENEIPIVTRIRLYQDYEAPPEYLVPLYGALCARDLIPTEEEAVELGFERMYRVFKARELLRSPVDAREHSGLSPLPKGMTEESTYPMIEEVFGLPPYAVPEPVGNSSEGGERGQQAEPVDETQAGKEVPILGTPKKSKDGKGKGKGANRGSHN